MRSPELGDECQRHRDYFGKSPDDILLGHYKDIAITHPVLDMGAGQGRHAFFLAEHGFRVHALEPVPVVAPLYTDAQSRHSHL